MDINSNILWSLISIIVSIICSIGFGYLFYKLALKKKSLTYEITTTCLISKGIADIGGLNVNYNSSNLDSLYRSKIKIKNSGNTIIDKNDIASKAPISLSTKGSFLFDTQILQLSNDENNIQLKFKTDEHGICPTAIIDFDFISKKQTVEFSILHTKNIKLNGRIKDGDIIEIGNNNIIVNDSKTIFNFRQRLMPIIISCFVACSISSIFIATIAYQKQSEKIVYELQKRLEENSFTSKENKYNIYELMEYISELEDEIRQLNPNSPIISQQKDITIQ